MINIFICFSRFDALDTIDKIVDQLDVSEATRKELKGNLTVTLLLMIIDYSSLISSFSESEEISEV